MGVLKAFNEWPSAIISLDPSRRIELGEMQHVSIVLKSEGVNVVSSGYMARRKQLKYVVSRT